MKYRTPLFLTITIFILLFGCSGKNKTSNTETVELPEVLKNDSLVNIYDFKIIDTFPDASPMTICFFDKSDNENPLFEKKYYQTGRLFMQGAYKNNKREGKWTSWYETGVMWSSGDYKSGLRHGQNMAYYEDGTLRYSKNYSHDLADGQAKFYTPDGNLAVEIMYASDTVVWKKEYDASVDNSR